MDTKEKQMNERQTQQTQKQLNGQFVKQLAEKYSNYRWGWFLKAGLKTPTEALIMPTQEQIIRTSIID